MHAARAQIEHEDSRSTAIQELIAQLTRKYTDRITGEITFPKRPGEYADLPSELHPGLRQALREKGIDKLYSHQSAAWHALAAGRHCVVVTPTASGKTLCYNLPVLQDALQARRKALYLFPTKALAQDQLAEISDLNRAAGLGVRAYTFDGDTPGDARRAVRLQGDIVVSNPDMLHQGILPHHTKWAQLFENLRYVVIDEMHTYRGIFGSHVANLLRRLARVCRFYGSEPQFILCSATIANPRELAQRLLGAEVELIAESGAPQGARTVLLWNPPVINAELGIRASARSQATRIARHAISRGLKTILFARTRLMVEVLTKYLKDVFDRDPRRPPRVHAYRGGYLPRQRRDTERALRSGEIDCVIATSALELGINVGSLDVAVLNGYPGTVAATLQRLGRAGRRNLASLGVLVASSAPLDQYLVRNPDFFLAASPEHARIDPEQLLILLDHIRCAAFELPFRDGERFGETEPREFLEYLAEEGVLQRDGSQWHWVADSYPANSVGLRSVAEGNFLVIDLSGGKQEVIAEADYFSVPSTLYEGAIYMVQAQPWQVERLDWEGRKAFVTKTRADYYTDAIDYTRLKILDRFEQTTSDSRTCARGEVHVVVRMAGYKKIRYYTHENIGYGKINLPDQEMHTAAVWWQIPAQVLADVFPNRWQAMEGFLGAAHALHFAATFLCMAEAHDLGRAVGDADGEEILPWNDGGVDEVLVDGRPISPVSAGSLRRFQPTLFLYDRYPGGIGLATQVFDQRAAVVDRAVELVRGCECPVGCPACVGPVLGEVDGDGQTTKAGAEKILRLLGHSE